MASSNLAQLQATMNRFAGPARFSPLAVDGGMGDKTASAVIKSLGWIGSDGCVEVCVDEESTPTHGGKDSATQLMQGLIEESGAISQLKIMQSVVVLNAFLVPIANFLNLEQAATVAIVKSSTEPSPGTLPRADRSQFSVKAPPSAGTIDKARLWFRQLPTTGQAGIGIGGALVLFLAFTEYRKRKAGGTVAGYESPGERASRLRWEARAACENRGDIWDRDRCRVRR